MMCPRTFSFLGLAPFALATAAGCSSDLPERVPVRGTVTLGGGPLPAAGAVYFLPTEPAEGLPMRPAVGRFDTDGSFRVETFKPDDGLMPGRYQVRIDCWKVPPGGGPGSPPVSYLPAKYTRAATSGLELVIESGTAARRFDIDIPAPR